MARRWIVSTAWLCSLVSAVDQTWHAYSVVDRTMEELQVSKSLLQLCRAWPAVSPPHYMGAKSNLPPQPPSAASVHCMIINIFNKY